MDEQRDREQAPCRRRTTWPAAALPALLVLALVGTAGAAGVSSSSARDVEMVVTADER